MKVFEGDTYKGQTVNQIIKKIQEGKATEQDKSFFIYKIERMVETRCVNRVNEDEDFEDLKQRCFCKIWKNIKNFDTTRNFSTYVWLIAEAALNHEYFRRQSKKKYKQAYFAMTSKRKYSSVATEVEVKMVIDNIFKRFPREQLILNDIFERKTDDSYHFPERINIAQLSQKFNRPYIDVKNFIRRDLKRFVEIQFQKGKINVKANY